LVIWLILAVVLVFGFTLGLKARKKPAVMDIPATLRSTDGTEAVPPVH
jgi:hypothetical protein